MIISRVIGVIIARVTGLLFFLFPLIFGIPETIKEFDTYKTGMIVRAAIVDLPKDCKGYHLFCGFKSTSGYFKKEITEDFCRRHSAGDSVDFLHSSKNPNDYEISGSADKYYLKFFFIMIVSCFGCIIFFKAQQIGPRLLKDW